MREEIEMPTCESQCGNAVPAKDDAMVAVNPALTALVRSRSQGAKSNLQRRVSDREHKT